MASDAHKVCPDELKMTYSVLDCVRVLGLSRATLYAEINAGRLRSYCVGRSRYVTKAAVADFIAAREAAAC